MEADRETKAQNGAVANLRSNAVLQLTKDVSLVELFELLIQITAESTSGATPVTCEPLQ